MCSIISPMVVTMPSMAELAWASISVAVWNDAYGAANLRLASRSASSAAVTRWQRLSTARVVSCSPGNRRQVVVGEQRIPWRVRLGAGARRCRVWC